MSVYPNEELRAITIELLPDEGANPGLYNCWWQVIGTLGEQPFQYFKRALEQLEAIYHYGDNSLSIEVYEFTNSPTDIATVAGSARRGEYHCQIGDLIALMQRTVEIYEESVWRRITIHTGKLLIRTQNDNDSTSYLF